jgi:hypothetical protein
MWTRIEHLGRAVRATARALPGWEEGDLPSPYPLLAGVAALIVLGTIREFAAPLGAVVALLLRRLGGG